MNHRSIDLQGVDLVGAGGKPFAQHLQLHHGEIKRVNPLLQGGRINVDVDLV